MSNYYSIQDRDGAVVGQVYTWDETGNRQITLFKTVKDTEIEAEDAITAYLDENGLDAALE